MKLVKVHVQNYRSILDSGEIEIEKIKTVLVGINEAGKTALLKAINNLNPASDIEKVDILRDFPRSKYSEYVQNKSAEELKKTPLVKGWFSLEQNDIDTIKELPNFSEGIIDLENFRAGTHSVLQSRSFIYRSFCDLLYIELRSCSLS